MQMVTNYSKKKKKKKKKKRKKKKKTKLVDHTRLTQGNACLS